MADTEGVEEQQSPTGQTTRKRKASPAVRHRQSASGETVAEETANEGGRSAPAVPWQRNPWVWTGVVVALVAAALGASVLVGTDARDPALAAVDHAEMCRKAEEFKRASSGGVDITKDSDVVRRMESSLREVAAAAPDVVRPAMLDWADGFAEANRAVDEVITKFGKDSTEAYDPVFQVLDRLGEQRSVSIDRTTNYVKKACNIDLNGASETTVGDIGGSTTLPVDLPPTGTTPPPPGTGDPGPSTPSTGAPGGEAPGAVVSED